MNENPNEQIQNNEGEKHQVILRKEEMFAGPVPHPEIIEKYENIYPGAAKIIFENWDSQVKHRHSLEKSVVQTDNLKSILGVIFGFIVALAAIGGGVYTALSGVSLYFGGGLSLAGLAMIVTAFIVSRERKRK